MSRWKNVYPQILVQKSKHYTNYYVVNSDYELAKAKAQVIASWWQNQMIWDPEPLHVSSEDKELLALTDEGVDALPRAVRDDVKKRRRRLGADVRENEQQREMFRKVVAFVNAESVAAAIAQGTTQEIMNFYGGGEYMDWDTEYPDNLDEWDSEQEQ